MKKKDYFNHLNVKYAIKKMKLKNMNFNVRKSQNILRRQSQKYKDILSGDKKAKLEVARQQDI